MLNLGFESLAGRLLDGPLSAGRSRSAARVQADGRGLALQPCPWDPAVVGTSEREPPPDDGHWHTVAPVDERIARQHEEHLTVAERAIPAEGTGNVVTTILVVFVIVAIAVGAYVLIRAIF